MTWFQHELTLAPRARGFHLITDEVLNAFPDIRLLRTGMLNIFLLHTSASLTLNENASPDVLQDFENHFNREVPESPTLYHHDEEGPDDMPAHLKASLLGFSLLLPLREGRPLLGTWQGLYLCEHRNHAPPRRLLLTAWGQPFP